MGNYIRGTVWSDGSVLAPTDLNGEFDLIQAVLNGGLDESNFAAGSLDQAGMINAGAARFQTGGLDAAEIVAGAIAEAVSGDTKVVFVPRALFGYAEAASFSGSMFNTGVLMVREGYFGAGHDPVAYGAKPDDATVDDQPSFQAAFDGAAAAAIGGNPGGAFVEVSLPGAYELGSDVTHDDATGYIERPGVTLTGAGTVSSQAGTAGIGKLGPVALAGLTTRTVESAVFNGSISANSSEDSEGSPLVLTGINTADWLLLSVRFELDEDGSGSPTLGFGLGDCRAETTNLQANLDRVEDVGGEYALTWFVNNEDASNPHTASLTILCTLVKREAL